MMRPLFASTLALALLSGCQYLEQDKAQQQQQARIDLNRRFFLVDEQGVPSGTVLLRPLGHGELRDNNGELIGVIVRPD